MSLDYIYSIRAINIQGDVEI